MSVGWPTLLGIRLLLGGTGYELVSGDAVNYNELWFIPPSDFLARLDDTERGALLELADQKLYRKNAPIFQAGSPGENVYILAEGRVKIYALSSLGKSVLLWFCFPGEVFGLAEVPRRGRREVYAEACSDSSVLSIPQDEFKAFLKNHPSTAMLVIDLLSCRLRALGDMLLNLTADDVTTRMLKLLIRLCARYGKQLPDDHICLGITLTHQEIADMVGTSRQTASSILGRLKRDGVLSIENHRIHVRSLELLEKIADSQTTTVAP